MLLHDKCLHVLLTAFCKAFLTVNPADRQQILYKFKIYPTEPSLSIFFLEKS